MVVVEKSSFRVTVFVNFLVRPSTSVTLIIIPVTSSDLLPTPVVPPSVSLSLFNSTVTSTAPYSTFSVSIMEQKQNLLVCGSYRPSFRNQTN